jgi:crotonobetainyl-CoA:carnitine CoA-transferase CaiB-like acyl-CoA transferase
VTCWPASTGPWGSSPRYASTRESTGLGQVVRTSLLSALVSVHAFHGTRWTVAGEVPGHTDNHHPAIPSYGAFRARDGFVQIAVGNKTQWRTFRSWAGPDEARY